MTAAAARDKRTMGPGERDERLYTCDSRWEIMGKGLQRELNKLMGRDEPYVAAVRTFLRQASQQVHRALAPAAESPTGTGQWS